MKSGLNVDKCMMRSRSPRQSLAKPVNDKFALSHKMHGAKAMKQGKKKPFKTFMQAMDEVDERDASSDSSYEDVDEN